jgi:hypothetical protein
MGTIKKHYEKEIKKNNIARAEMIESILKRKVITLDQYKKTALFIPKKEYLKQNINVKLNKDCVMVSEYIGGGIIQVDDEGIFTFNNFNSKDIDKVEQVLWEENAEGFWCKNC